MKHKLKSLGIVMLIFTLTLPQLSCSEDDNPINGLTLFGCSYKEATAGTVALDIQNRARAVDPSLESGSSRFLPEDIGGFGAANNIELDGDPTTIQSSLTIRMNREPQNDHTYARTFEIQILGPFVEGQTYTEANGEAEILLGSPINLPGTGVTAGPHYSTNSGTETYLELTITSLDIPNERLSGTFHFLAKRIVNANENPEDFPAIIVFDGSFSSDFNP